VIAAGCARGLGAASAGLSSSKEREFPQALMSSQSEPSKQVEQIEGRYANFFQVGHTAFEFLIDFGQLYPDVKEEQLHTRIVTSPTYAKELLRLIRDSIEQYERTYGQLPAP